jgi:hypothetical protein
MRSTSTGSESTIAAQSSHSSRTPLAPASWAYSRQTQSSADRIANGRRSAVTTPASSREMF